MQYLSTLEEEGGRSSSPPPIAHTLLARERPTVMLPPLRSHLPCASQRASFLLSQSERQERSLSYSTRAVRTFTMGGGPDRRETPGPRTTSHHSAQYYMWGGSHNINIRE